MEAEEEGIFYETLSPLSSAATAAGDTPPPQPVSDDSEPYVVFRNQISLDALHCPSLETSETIDYFSLDVNADTPEPKQSLISTPSPSPAAILPPIGDVEDGTLEGHWFRANCKFKSPMLQLHKEIMDFCDFLSPTPEEQASRKAAIDGVFNVIKYIWPNCKVEVFGSFKTGLYLPTSDIDVVILDSDVQTPQMGLHALSRALSQRSIAKKIQVIAKARVPIIKFIEKKSGVSFDISFDLQNGPKAAEFIKDAVTKWPPVRPLCLILKVFLQQRELNEVYTGGIGSYALLTMLIAMLRSLHQSQDYPEHNLGVLLVNFFDIYGRKLNTSDVGVTCNGAGTFFLKKSRGFSVKGRPCLISIEDPQAPENDIGKSSFNYFQVKSAFNMAFGTLTNSKTILGLGPNRSILGTIIRPDPVLVERKGGSNGEVTFTKLLPGAGEPLQNQVGDGQDIYCNWHEEEPLPRGNGVSAAAVENDGSAQKSPGKKRKKIHKEKKTSSRKMKENGGEEESGSRKEKGLKKKRWRNNKDGVVV